jgi:hypothetical protein
MNSKVFLRKLAYVEREAGNKSQGPACKIIGADSP